MSIGDVANALQIHVSLESFLLGQESHLHHSNLWFLFFYIIFIYYVAAPYLS